MLRRFKPLLSLVVIALLLASFFTGCVTTQPVERENVRKTTSAQKTQKTKTIDKNGSYTSKDDVALYIHTYGELPKNFITKKEAERLGWDGGSLEPYAPGKSIGGSYFGNYEGKLPKKKGRTYYECDIDTKGKRSRGPKRIVYSTDGLIYYTPDHYESFELLYGEAAHHVPATVVIAQVAHQSVGILLQSLLAHEVGLGVGAQSEFLASLLMVAELVIVAIAVGIVERC